MNMSDKDNRPDIGRFIWRDGSIKASCPFCGLHIEWGEIALPTGLAGSFVLAHVYPTCEGFEQASPNETIQQVKKKKNNPPN